jgi:CRISPR-associated protein Csm1
MEKRRKFMSILKKGLRGFTFDDMFDDLRKAGQCRYCGVYPAVEEIKDEEGEAIKVCRKCKSFVDIGRWLTDVEAISYAGVELRKERSIQILGGKVYLNFHEKLSEVSVGKSDKIYHLEIFKYKDGFVYPVKFIANYVPRWGDEEKAIYEKVKELKQDWESAKGRIKTFGEIAKIGTLEKDGNEEEGKPMLGILKADVDNLGKIFSVVFSKNMSISKYVTLSRGFDFYFSAFLDELVRKGYKNIYIVYSGGDDLLFVGEWKEIFDFAVEMYKKFRKYTTENENITLSAGIALVGPKYPINRGALMADEFLDRSKSFKENGKVVKDSLTVFNTTVRWEFLNELNEWRDKFEKWLESKDSKVKTTFLHRLLMYQKMAKSYYEDKDPKGLRFTYLLKYDVARNIIEVKDGKIVKGKEERDKLFELVDNNLRGKYKKLWLGLSIPISYVLYKYRGKKIKKKED